MVGAFRSELDLVELNKLNGGSCGGGGGGGSAEEPGGLEFCAIGSEDAKLGSLLIAILLFAVLVFKFFNN